MRRPLQVGDKVWYEEFAWQLGTIVAVGRFKVLVQDDSYKTMTVTRWCFKCHVHRVAGDDE